MQPATFQERVAHTVLTHFDSLPRSCKPRTLADGTREWVPISGIVLARNPDSSDENLTCVSVSTGSKCLPQNALAKCQGQVVHDCHAEILAIRAFNCWVLKEVFWVLEHEEDRATEDSQGKSSAFVTRTDGGNLPFQLREGVSIHMLSTEAPCGDASMEILMSGKQEHEREPWTSVREDGLLQGRGYFADLGVVRRKPSRPDAPPTLSKSCTDKLTVRSVTSLLSFPACLFLTVTDNAYLSSLILPRERYLESACERAFGPSGRMQNYATQNEQTQYAYHPFQVKMIDVPIEELPYTRPRTGKSRVGNVSALWIAGPNGKDTGVGESLINGVKQGFKQFSPDERRCSAVSRLKTVLLAQQILDVLQVKGDYRICSKGSLDNMAYDACKEKLLKVIANDRAKTKSVLARALGGWPRNIGDGDWILPVTPGEPKIVHEIRVDAQGS